MERIRRMLTSKRWIAFIATLAVLVLLSMLRAPIEVVSPLAEGVGLGLVAFLGVESAADGAERFARARRGPPLAEDRLSYPPSEGTMCRAYGSDWLARLIAAQARAPHERTPEEHAIVHDALSVLRRGTSPQPLTHAYPNPHHPNQWPGPDGHG